jgi:hypothetical protein
MLSYKLKIYDLRLKIIYLKSTQNPEPGIKYAQTSTLN